MSKFFIFSYLSRFEFLNFEKWLSKKRKTIEISGRESQSMNNSAATVAPKQTTSSNDIKCQAVAAAASICNQPYQVIRDHNLTILKSAGNQSNKNNMLNCSSITTCPSLIYLLATILLLLPLLVWPAQSASAPSPAQAQGPAATTAAAQLASPKSILGKALIERFLARDQRPNRDRWINVPSPLETIKINNEINRRPYRTMLTLDNLRAALNRLGNRIGARNTIRVHNAFRDLAWRLLSRLSMPTPVIYELRRQNLYSHEDDLMNDSLFNKNTTKTIRSRRQSNLAGPAQRQDGPAEAVDNDDERFGNLRARLRLRLEDLVNLSRRSLFGRVVRLPTLFPFKRQQQEPFLDSQATASATNPVALGYNISSGDAGSSNHNDNDSTRLASQHPTASQQFQPQLQPLPMPMPMPMPMPLPMQQQQQHSSKKALKAANDGSSSNNSSFRKTLSSLRARQKRRKKEADRQMIFINGKQYYVNDDGELKQWNDKE